MAYENFVEKREQGFTLIEVLVAMCILGLLALSLTSNTLMSFSTMAHVKRNALATQLANETMEKFARRDPQDLTDADDLTESVLDHGITFTRTVDVSIHADRSRMVTVTVVGANSKLGGKAVLSTSFALWGTR